MDMLRRNLAPINDQAWSEIDDLAKQTLIANLSARKFVDVSGPFGLDYSCVSLGRLDVPADQSAGEVQYGVHQVLPLVESRIAFSVNQWELDNVTRGAKDIELTSVVEAARRLAKFEETAVYKGFAPASIKGIEAGLEGEPITMGLDVHAVIDAVTEAQGRLAEEGIEGAAALVVAPALWRFLARNTQGGTLRQLLENQIAGPVVYSNTVDGALLASMRGGDTELVLGQDISIGYSHHDSREIHLFMTESFTFRVIAPEALVGFRIAS